MRLIKKVGAVILATVMVVSTNMFAYASDSYTGYTSGGSRDKTKVQCRVGDSSCSVYSQAYLQMTTVNTVDNMKIKNINIITSNGGGITGANTSGKSTKNLIYKKSFAPNLWIKSASGTFSISCSAFGSFTRNMSL